jgi:hypothetical protein
MFTAHTLFVLEMVELVVLSQGAFSAILHVGIPK